MAYPFWGAEDGMIAAQLARGEVCPGFQYPEDTDWEPNKGRLFEHSMASILQASVIDLPKQD